MIQEQIQTQAVPQTKSIPAKAYSVLEEWLNSISHGVGFIALYCCYRGFSIYVVSSGGYARVNHCGYLRLYPHFSVLKFNPLSRHFSSKGKGVA